MTKGTLRAKNDKFALCSGEGDVEAITILKQLSDLLHDALIMQQKYLNDNN